jgi:selenide,water dikinase
MLCGGCAAKVGQGALEAALTRLAAIGDESSRGHAEALSPILLGLAEREDAAAWRPAASGPVVVSSVDAFRAFTDDPWQVGRIGAVNALSDLFAKGAEPRLALALVTLPAELRSKEQEELLYQVLAGARAALDPLGVVLAGGHSTIGAELQVGFAVEGIVDAPEALLRMDRLAPDDVLVLTKPLGTGVLFHADMLGRARGPWIDAAIGSMSVPADRAARIASECGARAATDVTGYGLAGHLFEMLRASGLAARIDLGSVPALPGAAELLQLGLRSTFHDESSRLAVSLSSTPEIEVDPRFALLFDPQTAGGLLLGVPPDRAAEAVRRLRADGSPAVAVIGFVRPRAAGDPPIEVVSSTPYVG